jgi:hypothetical protein
LPYGQSFRLRRPVFCTFGPPEDAKGRKFGDFLPFQSWQRTCNTTGDQDIVRDSAAYRPDSKEYLAEPIAAACPFFWGRRRTYVSFVRTIHGGTCCYCCYSAARSFCCLSLGHNCFIHCVLGSLTPKLCVGKLSWRSGIALASFLLSLLCFAAMWDAGANARLQRRQENEGDFRLRTLTQACEQLRSGTTVRRRWRGRNRG